MNRKNSEGDEMNDFKIGDVVRLKTDGPDRLEAIVRSLFLKVSHERDRKAFCISDCGQRIFWEYFDLLELVHRPEPHADMKQAIREVLLSDEFLAAFAAAWMKTPLPLAMQYNTTFEIKNASELIPLPESEPTKAQSLADRTLKAIWQANDSTSEGGNQ